MIEFTDGDLEAAESQNIATAPQQPQQRAQVRQPVRAPAPAQAAPVAVPTNQIPVVAAPPSSPPSFAGAPPAGISIPKTDLAGAPSYAPRYVVPPMDPWGERLPFDVQQFRRRAADDDDKLSEDDDYKPSESKGKKHSPGVLKRFRNGIRNTGKAIVGAPSYILKRYRGTFKKYFGGGGGGKKKKGGWKAWSPSDKNEGWGGWEEVETTGGYYDDASHYPSEKGGWKSGGKGYKGYDSHERRYDRDSDRGYSSYRDFRDRDTTTSRDTNREYDAPPASSRPSRQRGERERARTPSYREETQYDEYDGRRTTAYYGPNSKKTYSKRPSSSSSYKYDDDY